MGARTARMDRAGATEALRTLGDVLASRGHLRQLEPTEVELIVAGKWAGGHDPSPGFRSVLLETLELLGIENADL